MIIAAAVAGSIIVSFVGWFAYQSYEDTVAVSVATQCQQDPRYIHVSSQYSRETVLLGIQQHFSRSDARGVLIALSCHPVN
jgi:hypothetical protein